MTRDQVELICKNVRELGQLVWEADKLQANDAEQRAMIEEQVEENRGLRADVLLMQQANAEQREEIVGLNTQVEGLIEQCICRQQEREYYKHELSQSHKKLAQQEKEITRLRKIFAWLLGEHGEFPDEPTPNGRYRKRFWWRSELRKRLEAITQEST